MKSGCYKVTINSFVLWKVDVRNSHDLVYDFIFAGRVQSLPKSKIIHFYKISEYFIYTNIILIFYFTFIV